jgi:hypothetical protein
MPNTITTSKLSVGLNISIFNTDSNSNIGLNQIPTLPFGEMTFQR